MTDEELRGLTRTDLLELLIIERKEIDRLLGEQNRIMQDLDTLNQKLDAMAQDLAGAQKLLQNNFLLSDKAAK